LNRPEIDRFRTWLRRSFVGPIIIAATLASALNGFLQGLRDPLHTAVSALINFMIRNHHLNIFPVAVPDLWPAGIFEHGIVVTGLLLLAIGLAYWMYPETRTGSQKVYSKNAD
jgi:hypothetical protein